MVFLDRIDSAPVSHDEFSFVFSSWFSVLVDTLNESFSTIENNFNNIQIQPLTTAQIVAASVTAPDGSIWYSSDHVPPVFVGKVNGALVQFTTAAFP
jgi:hypothetical protein